ncbi:MAG TPA: signal peptide peptidase SppA [Planctomycetota bacterium]|nr:signal peptide peptidase SppA [Planctomycetota bacterium]
MSQLPPPPPPMVVPVMTPEPRRSSGCLLALVVLLAVGLGLAVLVILAQAAKSGGDSLAASHPEPLREKWVAGEGDARVALVELSGVIMDEVPAVGFVGAPTHPVERIERELEEAAKDDAVKGVLFSVDSPGGAVTASDAIWHALRKFKERAPKKPLVVWMGSLAASGGYYVSVAADSIWASPTTITGSIGVIMQTFNFADISQKLGVKAVTIKSGANKDLLNAFRPLDEEKEQLEIVQRMVDEAYDLFVKRVADGRASAGLTDGVVRQLADGRIYTAAQAKENKLVDQIGYRDDALEDVKKRAGLKDAVLFRYHERKPGLLEVLGGEAALPVAPPAAASLGPISISVAGILSLQSPRLMYLWSPGAR